MRYLYLMWSFMLAIFLFHGIRVWSLMTYSIAAFAALILVFAVSVFLRKAWGNFGSRACLLPILLLLVVQTAGRIFFVIHNRSLEGPDGQGAPLVFLVVMFFEQLIFIPGLVFFIWLWKNRAQRISGASQAE